MPRLIPTFWLLCISCIVSAQARVNHDSLWSVYHNIKENDTVRAEALHDLVSDFSNYNRDSAFIVVDELEKFAIEKKNEWYLGISYQLRAILYKYGGHYSQSIASYYQCLSHWKEGVVSDSAIAQVHQNMATVYGRLHQFEKAKVHFDTALTMYSRSPNLRPIGSLYNDMGITYVENDVDLALSYLRKSFEIRIRIGNVKGAAFSSGNMAEVFILKKEPDSALHYIKLYYDYAISSKRNGLLISALTTIGSAYALKGDYRQAQDSCRRAYVLNELTIQNPERRRDICNCLYEAYSGLGNSDSALKYYRQFVMVRDTLQSQSQRDEVTHIEFEFQYREQRQADSLKNAQEIEIFNTRSEGEKNLRYALYAGLGLTIFFGVIMFNRFRTTRRQKELIAKQQEETEKQKKLIEEKNKEITDSINYAQRIQQAILPPEGELKKSFADIFVLFHPRDIVSGDFYWYDESSNIKVIAVADCTGHGVPGGFMSMLGFEILQDVVLQEEITSTSEVLSKLDQKVTITLNKNDKTYRDGMDMAFCAFPKGKMEVLFSGANRSLLHFSEGVMKVYKPDKHTIGGAIDNVNKDFTMHVIPLKKGDMLYMFTDGYADQFGGPNGKKFMSKKLEQLLTSVAALDCGKQKSELKLAFDTWRGALEQVDDVCVIGIRV